MRPIPAFQGPVRVRVIVAEDHYVVGHQPDLGGQVPVDAECDVVLPAAGDRST